MKRAADRRAGIVRRSGAKGSVAGLRRVAAALIALGSVWAVRADAASFVVMTPLEGIDAFSGVALSADGSTVVGNRLNRNRVNPAFLWTRADGFRDLDELGPTFRAEGISGDGSRIVGSLDGEPVVWDRDGSPIALTLPVGGTSGGSALGVSDDGRYAVGRAHDGGIVEDFVIQPGGGVIGIPRPREVPVRWSIADGEVVALVHISGAALDVSNDGVAVGNVEWPVYPGGELGLRWDPENGPQYLPSAMPGGQPPFAYSALSISADGRTIVGSTPSPPLETSGPLEVIQTYLWEGEPAPGDTLSAADLVVLDFPGYPISFTTGVKAISSDGSTIVGAYHRDVDVAFTPRPFIWTRDGGFQDLEVLLNTLGISTTDWVVNGALDVSADGRTIIGTGRGRNAAGRTSDMVWIAVIPEPSTALLLGAGLSMLAIRPRGRSAARHRARGA
ncbi:MAG: PEP-CTERM sorting domain-containing protein [Myxococcota bacterium]